MYSDLNITVLGVTSILCLAGGCLAFYYDRKRSHVGSMWLNLLGACLLAIGGCIGVWSITLLLVSKWLHVPGL